MCIYNLGIVSKELVELNDSSGNRKVDGSVTNLNNKTTKDIRVDLVSDLELLAAANKGRFSDGALETVDSLGVERGGGGDGSFHNSLGSVGQSLKLVSDGWEKRQSVVLSKDVKEVGDGLVGLGRGRKGFDDSLLVDGRKGRVAQDLNKLLVLAQDGLEASEGRLGSREGGGLDRGGVLNKQIE